ncbi:hypothetical protein [Ferrimonas balearica]|uniref:hypothetical protein n=1 Tax=Ferrimonas balearica TaxID=44012 RepID=UPI001C99FA13|nr:hypothetical protein [Ferrimonas balearica]MBY5992518.1 hypothetical protein [Ferrimonas balearica]
MDNQRPRKLGLFFGVFMSFVLPPFTDAHLAVHPSAIAEVAHYIMSVETTVEYQYGKGVINSPVHLEYEIFYWDNEADKDAGAKPFVFESVSGDGTFYVDGLTERPADVLATIQTDFLGRFAELTARS